LGANFTFLTAFVASIAAVLIALIGVNSNFSLYFDNSLVFLLMFLMLLNVSTIVKYNLLYLKEVMLKDKKKICYKCKGTDDLFEIRAHKGKNIYFLCKPCNKKDKKYYHDSGKKMVYEHYGARCNCCGESKYQFLSVDHVNNDGGEERWPNGNRITGVHLYRRIIS